MVFNKGERRGKSKACRGHICHSEAYWYPSKSMNQCGRRRFGDRPTHEQRLTMQNDKGDSLISGPEPTAYLLVRKVHGALSGISSGDELQMHGSSTGESRAELGKMAQNACTGSAAASPKRAKGHSP